MQFIVNYTQRHTIPSYNFQILQDLNFLDFISYNILSHFLGFGKETLFIFTFISEMFVGAGITGYYVDRTRKYIKLAKIFGLLYGLSCF